MRKIKKFKKISIGQVLLSLIMIAFTITILTPVLNMVARSFSDPSVSAGMSGLQLWPEVFNTINYKIVLSNAYVIPAFLNSVFVTIAGAILNVVMTSMAAYALTRPGLVGKRLIMAFLIIMMLFDPGLVAEYLVVKEVGLMGSLWAIILVSAVNVYYLVIMMRYFNEVPQALIEAAYMDGAGHLRILFSIVAPLAKAGVVTITMFYTVLRWNEYLRSGLYVSSINKSTLQVILRKFVVEGDTANLIGQQNIMNYNELAQVDYTALQYATIVIAVAPLLLIYPLVLTYYQKGVLTGGVKG